MNEYEELFNKLSDEKGIKPNLSQTDKIIISVESEFQGENIYADEEQSRLDEESALQKRKKELQEKLKKYKNVKNPNLQHVNKTRADKRKEIKRKIMECNLRLSEIEMERPKN